MTRPDAPLRLLVTGGRGFIGRHLIATLLTRDVRCRIAVRHPAADSANDVVAVGDIGPQTDWHAALEGIETVVHLASRAHVLREHAPDPRGEFMRVNAEGTARLVSAALAAGVRRFVYVSSIGVLGNAATEQAPFGSDSPPRPHNFYSESKLAAEQAATAIAGARLDIVIVRPPLVYGSGVPANFLRLLRWIDRGWPLPFGAVANRRSLVSVWNLCDLLALTLTHAAAAGRCWLVADGQDLSTPDLLRRLGSAMKRRTTLVPVPTPLLYSIGTLTGTRTQLAQLCGSLVVDATYTHSMLGWRPPVPLQEGLQRTADWYMRDAHPELRCT